MVKVSMKARWLGSLAGIIDWKNDGKTIHCFNASQQKCLQKNGVNLSLKNIKSKIRNFLKIIVFPMWNDDFQVSGFQTFYEKVTEKYIEICMDFDWNSLKK